jgi:hypothetical protein
MVNYRKSEYKLKGFEKSNRKDKKYNAILQSRDNPNAIVKVPFGGIRKNGIPYDQYRDKTPLRLYSKYDHNDKERRRLYRGRHMSPSDIYYNPNWFSHKYLW